MPRLRLTDAAVRRLKPPLSGQVDYFDELLPGFGLRISAKGRKSWFVFFRIKAGAQRGKQKRYTLASSAEALSLSKAREEARDILRRVERGEDPAADRKQARSNMATAKTVREAADQFVERYAKPRNKSWPETKRILDRYVSDAWGDRPLSDIKRADVIDLLDDIADRAPVMANRVLANARRMFRWHVERGTVEASPVEGVTAPTRERHRDRVLSDDEIRWFWQATGEADYPFGPLYRLLLVTAQRRDEVALAEWSEIDLAKATWTIPRGKVKSDREHEVPLSPLAIEIIRSLHRVGPLLFSTSLDGARPVSGFSHSKQRIVEAMDASAVKVAEEAGHPVSTIPDWRLHDLRRTAGTNMAAAGVPTSTISRVLNHAEGGVTAIYDRHHYSDQKRDALERWARRLDAIVGNVRGNVVALSAGER